MAAAVPPEPGSHLRVVAAAAVVTLGQEAGVDLEIAVEPPSAAPPGALPTVSASVGSVGEVRAKESGGGFLARFTPPESKTPAAAILVARLDGGAEPLFGAATIRLIGTARVDVQTEPSATVRLEVAGNTVGPLQADAAGEVRAAVPVPPGVAELEVLTVDRAGNKKRRRQPLSVPPFARLHLAPPPAPLVANGRELAFVGVAAASPRGDLEEARVTCTSDTGQLDAVGVHGGAAVWRLSVPRLGGGSARITCKGAGRQAPAAELPVALRPGPLQEVSLTPPAAPCEPGEVVPLDIAARDDVGNPVRDLSGLAVEAAVGRVELVPHPDGSSTWMFEAPARLPPNRQSRVAVRHPASGAAGEAVVPLAPGPVASIVIGAGEPEIAASAGETVRLALRAADAQGNGVAPESLAASAAAGTARIVGDGAGARLEVVVPEAATDEVIDVAVRGGAVESHLLLRLSGRWEHTDLTVRAGAQVLQSGRFGPVAAAALTVALPVLDGGLRARLEVGGLFSTINSPLRAEGERLGRVQQSFWLLPVTLGVLVRYPLSDRFGLGGGVGGGVGVLWTVTDISGDPDLVPPDRTEVYASPTGAAHVGADVDLGFGRLELALHLHLALARIHPNLRGDYGSLALTVGWQLGWPRAPWRLGA